MISSINFTKEGIARRTIDNAINRLANKQPIKDKNQSGRSAFWTPDKTPKLPNKNTKIPNCLFSFKFYYSNFTIVP